jgi:uncharacterized protein (DUF2147 family)
MKISLLLHIVYFLFPSIDVYFSKHVAGNNIEYSNYTTVSADAILGEWIDDLKTVKIAIYKENALYHAKVVWLKEPGLASIGSSLMRNLTYAGNNSWEKGMLFYPRTKTWYKCNCFLATKSLLKLRVFSGIPLLGKTIYFKKTG